MSAYKKVYSYNYVWQKPRNVLQMTIKFDKNTKREIITIKFDNMARKMTNKLYNNTFVNLARQVEEGFLSPLRQKSKADRESRSNLDDFCVFRQR